MTRAEVYNQLHDIINQMRELGKTSVPEMEQVYALFVRNYKDQINPQDMLDFFNGVDADTPRGTGTASTGNTMAGLLNQYWDYDWENATVLINNRDIDFTTSLSDATQSAAGPPLSVPQTVGADYFADMDSDWTLPSAAMTDVKVDSRFALPDTNWLAQADTPYDFTGITQGDGTTVDDYITQGKIAAGLFDPINFPENPITRGTPVVTGGIDSQGRPTSFISMGSSTATPTGEDIGKLTTEVVLPGTGMGIASTGLGTAFGGTTDTTGNIVKTNADDIVRLADEFGTTKVSPVDNTVINTGGGTVPTVTTNVIDQATIPGSPAFCAVNPEHPSCVAGTDVFCDLFPNDDSCKTVADPCEFMPGTVWDPIQAACVLPPCPVVDGVQQRRPVGGGACATPTVNVADCPVVDGVQQIKDADGNCVNPVINGGCEVVNGVQWVKNDQGVCGPPVDPGCPIVNGIQQVKNDQGVCGPPIDPGCPIVNGIQQIKNDQGVCVNPVVDGGCDIVNGVQWVRGPDGNCMDPGVGVTRTHTQNLQRIYNSSDNKEIAAQRIADYAQSAGGFTAEQIADAINPVITGRILGTEGITTEEVSLAASPTAAGGFGYNITGTPTVGQALSTDPLEALRQLNTSEYATGTGAYTETEAAHRMLDHARRQGLTLGQAASAFGMTEEDARTKATDLGIDLSNWSLTGQAPRAVTSFTGGGTVAKVNSPYEDFKASVGSSPHQQRLQERDQGVQAALARRAGVQPSSHMLGQLDRIMGRA